MRFHLCVRQRIFLGDTDVLSDIPMIRFSAITIVLN